MIRLLLRGLNAPALILMVAIGIAIQTSLFNSYPLLYLQPDVTLLIVIWCALRRSFTEGGIVTLIVAQIAELHSASPQGLLLITFMLVYLLVRGAARLFVIPGLPGMIMVTLAASVFWKFAYLGVLLMMGTGSNQWRHLFVLLFPGAVMEGVVGIWVYRGLEKFDWVTYKNVRARQALEDEMQLDGEGL